MDLVAQLQEQVALLQEQLAVTQQQLGEARNDAGGAKNGRALRQSVVSMVSAFIEHIQGASPSDVIDLCGDVDDHNHVQGSKRAHSSSIDEANARAKKAEHDRAAVCREKALLLTKLANAKQKLRESEQDREKQGLAIVVLKQRLDEAEAAKEKLKQAEATAIEAKCAAAKLVIEDLKAKMDDLKIESEKKIADMKKAAEAAEAERELDIEYAELKKALKSAKWRHGFDEELNLKAYRQIFDLRRDLTDVKEKLAAAKKKLGEDEDTEEPDKSEEGDKSKGGLKGCSAELVAKIEADIIDKSAVTMDDIAGLDFAKKCVNELIVWPMTRPDIFTGLRALPRGLLLFGPPGTGKTMIGKAIANQSGATFFYISASSIASKWAGESEQLVRTLFVVASSKQPSVIFIDEIDSMLTRRSDDDSGFRRAIKTEFMVQLDGMTSNSKDRILIIGATNCPHTLDEAIRRRFVKRMYIPLPATGTRLEFMKHALRETKHGLTPDEFAVVAESTEGFSCADMHALCTEAALGPVREITDIREVKAEDIRAVQHQDFVQALGSVKSSVGVKDLKLFEDWNAEFGSFPV